MTIERQAILSGITAELEANERQVILKGALPAELRPLKIMEPPGFEPGTCTSNRIRAFNHGRGGKLKLEL